MYKINSGNFIEGRVLSTNRLTVPGCGEARRWEKPSLSLRAPSERHLRKSNAHILPAPWLWTLRVLGWGLPLYVEGERLSSVSSLFLGESTQLSHLDWPSFLPALLQVCKPLPKVISNLTSTLCLIVLLSCFSILEAYSWESLWIPIPWALSTSY